MQACEPVEKSRFTVWFQWFVAPEGRKVGSLKRRVQSHLARWEISKSKRAKYTVLGPLLEVEMLKKCMPLWRISKSKRAKHTSLGALLEVEMPKKCTPLWCETHFEVKSVKNWWSRTTFGRSDAFRMAGARDCAPWQKWAKKGEGFVAVSTTTTTTLCSTTLQLLLQLQLHLNYIRLHYATLITLHDATRHDTTLH